MTAHLLTFVLSALTSFSTGSGYYEVGSEVADFELKNVDGTLVSLSDYPEAKGFVVVFTCNHCPYAVAYQDRIIALDQEYKAKGYPVIAISSTNAEKDPRDSYENMVIRAREKNYTFPYLYDENQEVLMKFGAQATPTAYLLTRNRQQELEVKYIGAIDDNYQDAQAVKVRYLENALDAVMSGNDPQPSFTKAIGCSISYNDSPVTMR